LTDDVFWSQGNHIRDDLVLFSLMALIVYLVLGVVTHAAMIRAVTEIYIGQQQHQPEEASVVVSLKRLLGKGLCNVGSIVGYWMVLFFGLLVSQWPLENFFFIGMSIVEYLFALIWGQNTMIPFMVFSFLFSFAFMPVLCFAIIVATIYIILGFFCCDTNHCH
jgi:hypothetical protein